MITLTHIFHTTPEEFYRAWLSGKKHALMTQAGATGSTRVGGRCTAWDGYISAQNIELAPGKKIVQAWRTSDFAEDDKDSTLTLTVKKVADGTLLTLKHVGTPKDQEAGYKTGWEEYYFTPMDEYFG
jgi:activator of HSP90 ATPase